MAAHARRSDVRRAGPGRRARPIPGRAGASKAWTISSRDIQELIADKTVGASILYAILLFLAMLAIFNTQVLSIFRRRHEMGTMMALGFTRGKVIGLFTLEGR